MCWSKEWKHNDLSGKKVEKIIYDFKRNGGKDYSFNFKRPLLSKNFQISN